MIADGAIASRTAYLSEPYEGSTDDCGIRVMDPEEVERPSEKPEKTESPASQGNEKTAPGKTPAGPETKDAREELTQSSSATAPEDEAGSSGGGLLMGVLWSLGGAIAGAGGLLFYLKKKHYF